MIINVRTVFKLAQGRAKRYKVGVGVRDTQPQTITTHLFLLSIRHPHAHLECWLHLYDTLVAQNRLLMICYNPYSN